MEHIPLGSSAPVGHHMHLLRDEQSCSPFQPRSFGGHEVQSTHRVGSLQHDQVSAQLMNAVTGAVPVSETGSSDEG